LRIAMPFKEYLGILRGYCNAPLTLNRITLPFGVISDAKESKTLLVGHVLDDLAARFDANAAVDPIDVAAAAYDLGHEEAGAFLEEAPIVLSRMARDMGLLRIH
jgi:hypothetical protein